MLKTTHYLFLFILIFTPLAFGTVEQWSLTVMESLSFLTVVVFFLHALIKKEPIFHVPGLLPLMLFQGYILFQIIPLPPAFIRVLSAQTFQIYQETVNVLDPSAWLTISLNKKATLMEFYRYSSYVGIYFLSVQLMSDKERLKKTIYVLVAFFSMLSVVAMVQHFTSSDLVFWFREVPENSTVFGPYLNHNHFAGLMGMVLPIAIGLFWFHRPHILYKQSIREKITDIIYFPKANLHILIGCSIVLICASIILSSSRMTIFSICLATIFLVGLIFVKRQQIRKGPIFLLILVLIIFSLSWFSWESTFGKLGQTTNSQEALTDKHITIWKDSIRIIRAFPVTGVGFGNFNIIYPRYKASFNSESVLHVHNDYIELLIEGGIIALILIGWFLFELLNYSFKEYNNRRERYSIYLFLGCMTGIISTFIGSVTNFGFHIGANSLYMFFLSGLLVSTAHTKIRGNKHITLRVMKLPGIKMILFNGAVLVFLTGLIVNARIMIAEKTFSTVENVYLNEHIPSLQLESIKKIIEKASRLDPLEAKYHYAFARIDTLMRGSASPLSNYAKAINQTPLNSEYLQSIGLIASWLKQYKLGNKLLRVGVKNDASNPQMYKTYADWLFSLNQKKAAMEVLEKALSHEPDWEFGRLNEYINFMLVQNLSEREMLSIMSKSPKTLIPLAGHFVQTGNKKKAEEAYRLALVTLRDNSEQRIVFYEKIYDFYVKKNKHQEALNVALQAIEKIPHDAMARIWAAQIYEKQGITYRAIEEYKTALTIDRSNKPALNGLKRLNRR